MTTKEKVKREIDKMPNDLIEKVYNYINSHVGKKPGKRRFTHLI